MARTPKTPTRRPLTRTGHAARLERFVEEYLIDLNASQAAIRAGYSPKTAGSQACDLLKNPKVQALVAEGKRRQIAKADLSAVRVLEELRRIAMVDPAAFEDAHGLRRHLREVSAEARAALAAWETDGDGRLSKIRLHSKNEALTTLARHFKLLTDVIQLADPEKKIQLLRDGRARAAAAAAALRQSEK